LRPATRLTGTPVSLSFVFGCPVVTLCAIVAVAIVAVLGFGQLVPSQNFGGQDQPMVWLGHFANVPLAANSATGAERVEQWRELARDACASQSVKALARQFETQPTPEAVARGYGRYVRIGNPPSNAKAAHDGCLQGFQSRGRS
jgi:hypothetical protein